MAIFALSDLHLPLGIDKPMDVFGSGWEDYIHKIEYMWKETVSEEDFVIINGDFSWATYLEESIADFKFIEALPGTKLLSKGNHDYWWSTLKKMNEFAQENSIESVRFMQNNALLCGEVAVCGAKGWKSPDDKNFKSEDLKIYKRELIRFETSVKEAYKLSDTVIACLHFPPDEAFMEIADKYDVHKCLYGHLHGKATEKNKVSHEKWALVSADFLKFTPIRIF